MLVIRSPISRMPEREYIYDVLLREFLGLEYMTLFEDRPNIEISLQGGGERRLTLADVLLSSSERLWLKEESLPSRPLKRLFREKQKGLPILYGRAALESPESAEGEYLHTSEGESYCGIDIFGGAFFLLTRYEELVIPERDHHGRFPAAASLAVQEDFIDIPLVNEYTELLFTCLKELWPGLSRPVRQPRRLLSHDVDFPYYVYGRSNISIMKQALADGLLRRNMRGGLQKMRLLFGGQEQRLALDPFNTFEALMQGSEQLGLRGAFYFMTEQTHPRWDGNYTTEDPRIQRLMRQISERGHEIGLHPSYESSDHPGSIAEQFRKLRDAAEQAGVKQEAWGGRQHYLRLSTPDTWQEWEEAGLSYDSSLGYPERAGFRTGTCYEYPVFNLLTRTPLQLRERPLIVMEQSILHPEYMGLQGEEALGVIRQCYTQCMKYNGDFTLLWHNSQLVHPADVKLFESTVDLLRL